MSKLFKLKEWLTVADAAKHLTIVFGEEVTEADILRFALDGKLKLSANFVNGGMARIGKLVPIDEATYQEVQMPGGSGLVRLYGGPSIFTDGVESHILMLDKDVSSLDGWYDLPMIGGERHDVEHRFQALTGGPAITLESLDGAFVDAGDGMICQLQEDYEDNESASGSIASLKRLKYRIVVNKIEASEAEKLLNHHKEDRRKFLEQRKSRPRSENFYPAGGLPDDCVLVVRTAALMEFMQSVNEEAAGIEKPLGNRERDTLLTIIAALCKDAKYDYTKHAKTAGLIQSTVTGMGAHIGETTIENHLKKIPDALGARMK